MSEGITPQSMTRTFCERCGCNTLIACIGAEKGPEATAIVASLVGQQTARPLLRVLGHAPMHR